MRAYDLPLSMRVMGLMLALGGCGGDSAAKPAATDADDDDLQAESSCSDGDKCVRTPIDAGSTPRPDASAIDAPDAGIPIMSTPDAAASFICPLEDNDDICSTCLKFSCCEEIIACGPACQELVQCANACPSTSRTDPCAQRCFEQHAEGMAAFTAFASCVGVQCEEACSSSQ